MNRLNFDTARDCALGAAAFAALPHEVAGPLTALVVAGAGLYYYRGGSGGVAHLGFTSLQFAK